MPYKMSYKLRSFLFFFGFFIAAILCDSMDEELIVRTVEPQQKVNQLDNEDLVEYQLNAQGTVVNID